MEHCLRNDYTSAEERKMQKVMRVTVIAIALVLCAVPGYVCATESAGAMDEVVVTATRLQTPTEEVGSSITVITAKDIEAKGYTTADEVLRGTLGVDVFSAGGPGQASSVFVRGANSYQSLVLIDGVEMNEPSGINRGFNFANLTVDNIERIEVLRGPQSPLYGADAMGGVINIITKKGEGEPRFFLGGEGGSYNTWREFAGAQVGSDRINLSVEASHTSSDGFSSADDNLPGNAEDDKWENASASARLGFVLSENIDLDFIGRFQNGRTHLDNGGGPNQDAEDYSVDERKVFTKAQVNVFAFDGLWEQTLAYGFADHTRDYTDDPWSGDYTYDGKKHEVSWQNDFYLHETNTLTLGLEYEREEMDDNEELDVSAHTKSMFAQDQIKLGEFSFTTVGVRYDDHENFGSETTWRITQAFLLRNWGTKFKGSYGTGFRAPSLNELYYVNPWGGPGGNPDLDPETSKGWDAGIEQSLFNKRLNMGVTYFYNDFEDLIVWDNGYNNVDTATAEGIESFIAATLSDNLSLELNYTYTDTEDNDGRRLLRRPLHKIGLNTRYRFLERATVNLDVLYVGERDDSYWDAMTFTTRDVVLDDYILVNLAASFDVCDYLTIFGRIENLFDEDYYEAYGYGTAGASAYGGVKINF
jgi:vitamin B12 transporter